jgi:hypothetical protein
MKRAFNPIVAAIVPVLSFAAPVATGQLEDTAVADQGFAEAQNGRVK